jgi:arylsulfatase
LVVGSADIPTGVNLILSASFEKEGQTPLACTGTLALFHGDAKVGEATIKTQLGAYAIAGSGIYVGRHAGEPVTDDYPGEPPYAFTGGTLHEVAVDVSGDPYLDLERHAEMLLKSQ